MKLLLTSGMCTNLYEKEAYLKSKGIAIYISDRGGASMKSGIEIGLWVVLDSQFDEAKNVLLDENYVVKNPLSWEDMQQISGSVRQSLFRFSDEFINKLMIVVLLSIVVFILYRVFS